jgi:hypothetical protein
MAAPTIEELKEEVGKLHGLLEAPEPGLSTWWMFLHDRISRLHTMTGAILKASGTELNPDTGVQALATTEEVNDVNKAG